MKGWNEILAQLTMLGQLGLSLATPILMCLAVCYLMTAYKVYLSVTNKAKKPRRGKEERSFNGHR